MDGFDHLLNWKLKRGSHSFPGKDGGTCINEAALVAAGFSYRPIGDADQMPKCFSRPICRFAMQLNDEANDKDRQRLLPYVTRLACADTPEIERQRQEYILRHTSGYYVKLPLSVGLEALEGALAIGRQADPLGLDEVETRRASGTQGGSAWRQPITGPQSTPWRQRGLLWRLESRERPAGRKASQTDASLVRS